jgi:hypothetical protein
MSEVTVGLGANWIHNLNHDVNPLYTVAVELGVDFQVTSPDDDPGDDIALFRNGEKVPEDVYKRAVERYSWMKEQYEDTYDVPDVPHITDVYNAFEALRRKSESVLGACSEEEAGCIHWFYERMAIDYAAPLGTVSLVSSLEGESDGLYGEGLVSGGMSRILEPLSKYVRDDILLNHEVERVACSRDKDCIEVCVRCKNGQEIIATMGCIVTVPISMIKNQSIQFSETPTCIKRLLNSPVEQGLMNIIWLWYPYSFWTDDINYFGAIGSDDCTTFLLPKMMDSFGAVQPIVMCQVVGKFAVSIQTLSEVEVATIATMRLRTMLGPGVSVPDAVGCCFSSWGSERLIQGSWSYYPTHLQQTLDTGDSDRHSPSSGGIDDFVFYAGEAASIMSRGTVHGAYISGIEAAKGILLKRGISTTY